LCSSSLEWCSALRAPSRFAGGYEPGFVGEHYGLDAVAEAKFAEDSFEVRFYGGLAEGEIVGDLAVRHSPGDEGKDLEFARSEFLQCGRRRAGWRRACELLDQPFGDGGSDQRVARSHDPDGGDQLLGKDVLEEESTRSGAERVVYVLVEVEGGQHEDGHRMVMILVGEDAARCLEPVDVWHLDVHQHDVWMTPVDEVDRVATVAGLTNDADPRLFLKNRSEAGPYEGLIVGDQYCHWVADLIPGFRHGRTVAGGVCERIIREGHIKITPRGDDLDAERAYSAPVYRLRVSGYDRRVTGRRLRALLGWDVLICVALLAFGVNVTTRSDLANGTIVDTLLLPAVALPILLRWRWPLVAALALFAGSIISGLPTFDQFRLGVAIPAAMLILFSLASRSERRRALVGLGLVLAAMVFIGLTDRVLRGNGGLPAMVLFSFPLCLTSWGAGRAAWSRDRLADKLAAQSALLTQQRELTAQLAVEVERTRLASELDMSARVRVRDMIDLAQHGKQSLTDDPGDAREAFARIERMGRESLNEMRDLLGVLRSDERGSRSPRPTLAQIEGLLDELRARGRLVDLKLQGERRPLPLGVELASYRALQHALAAVNGSPGEPVSVQLRYLSDSLELEIRGAPSAGVEAEAAVAAARERIVAHGGSFSSDLPSGRRVLRAALPVGVAHG
jgi:signal transduction histidine kinase